MKSTLTKTIFATLTAIVLGTLYATPTIAANTNACDTSIPADIRKASGCSNAGANTAELPNSLKTILTGVISIMGVIAIIFVIVGGVQYLTSAGDASKTEKAKRTIIYALIGLIVCALSFTIVQFVIGGVLQQ